MEGNRFFFAEGAFESGPTNARPNLTTSSANLNDPNSQLSWGLSTTSTSSSQAQKPPPYTQSPNPWSQPSNTKNPRLDTIGWGVNPLEEGSSAPNTAVPSPAVMTKEEKALEMTKRKEERKQVCLKQAFRGKSFIIFVSANCNVEGAEEGRNKDVTSLHPITGICHQ
jgi:hypothetical protein